MESLGGLRHERILEIAMGIPGTSLFSCFSQHSLGSIEESYGPRPPADADRRCAIAEADIIEERAPVLEQLVHGVTVAYTADQRSLIRQGQDRDCFDVAMGMLIHDRGGDFVAAWREAEGVQQWRLRTTETIRQANMRPMTSFAESSAHLAQLVEDYGPAMVSIERGQGCSCVIVDGIYEKVHTARIRDPERGRELIVRLPVLEQRIHYDDAVVQIGRPYVEGDYAEPDADAAQAVRDRLAIAGRGA
jgi:hypothetical protein